MIKTSIGGIPLARISLPEVLDGLTEKKWRSLGVVNAHVMALCQENREFRRTMVSHELLIPETAPVTFLLNLKNPNPPKATRIFGPDLMAAALKCFPPEAHFLLGRDQETIAKIAGAYKIPERQTASYKDPEGHPEEILERILATNASLVWCGFGTPFQQKWCAQNQNKTQACLIGIGYGLVANAKVTKRPPEWALKSGTAWIFRLIQEPRRLGPRYLRYNSKFLILAAKTLLEKK